MTDETLAQEAPVAAPEPQEVQAEPTEAQLDDSGAVESEAPSRSNNQIDDWIDFDALPDGQRDKVESRIRTLAGQVKKSYEINDQLVKDLRGMHNRLNNFEAGQNAERFQGTLTKLKTEWQEAFDMGDSAKAFEVSQKMTALQAQAAQAAAQYKRDKEQEDKQSQAAQPTSLSEGDIRAISQWRERRPFLDDERAREWVQNELSAMYQDGDWDWQPVEDKLKEIDRRYKARTRRSQSPEVLTSSPDANSRSRGKAKWQQLSEPERAVAVRMFPELSRDDAFKAYAEGKD